MRSKNKKTSPPSVFVEEKELDDVSSSKNKNEKQEKSGVERFKLSCKELDSESLVSVFLPKLILNSTAINSNSLVKSKSSLVLVFDNNTQPRNVYKEILQSIVKGIEKLNIEYYLDEDLVTTWNIINPKILAVDFGHLSVMPEEAGKRLIVVEVDYDEITIDNDEKIKITCSS